ncbi:unnamed protein product [Calypogeia fissa]
MRGVQRCGLVQLLALLQMLMVVTAEQSYVVYMGGLPAGVSPTSHHEKLTALLGSEAAASDSMIYSYKNFNGFAAKLSPEQADALKGQRDVISVFPNRAHNLHTTHSWSFLNVEDNNGNIPANSLWKKSNYGENVIIGLLDTGVWPESASFSDAGLGPIPSRWKGECAPGELFGPAYCNKKLIGGRYFIKGFEAQEGPLNTTATGDYLSARDSDGHGTHTSSTAGGNFAKNANCLGFAPGTAKGGAPLGRVAMYKVCWPSSLGSGGCYDADILMAFDQSISDGVDVVSVSLGSSVPLPAFFQDGIAIGSFHAALSGISVACSAGNDGPTAGTVANVAPWVTTVAAGSIDRDFSSYATLGNQVTIKGESLSQAKLDDKFYPLVSAADIYKSSSNSSSSQLCFPDSMDPVKANGKIVVCLRGVTARIDKGQEVKLVGGIGMILANDILSGDELLSDPHVLPATQCTYKDGLTVFSYINSTTSPTAMLSPATTVLGVKPAPVLTAFSSEGPNSLIPDLFKPDITGPGLNILAAYTQSHSVTGLPGDNRIVQYNIISGTSMSCPHVAGTLASLKGYHPTWSPAALHSAIVTTGSLFDNENEKILNSTLMASNPFGIGGGYLNPNSAAEPGLVYDNRPVENIKFLCSLNYTQDEIAVISGYNVTCPKMPTPVTDYNYPSLAVSQLVSTVKVKRTVTNVGSAYGTYTVTIVSPPGIKVTISPSVLKFTALGQKKTFYVTLTEVMSTNGGYSFGSYTWYDGTHSVRSPMAVKTAQ